MPILFKRALEVRKSRRLAQGYTGFRLYLGSLTSKATHLSCPPPQGPGTGPSVFPIGAWEDYGCRYRKESFLHPFKLSSTAVV